MLDNVNVVVPCYRAGLSFLEPGAMEDEAIIYIREDASIVPSATRKAMLSLSSGRSAFPPRSSTSRGS